MGRGPVPERELIYRGPLSPHRQSVVVLCCISPPFGRLSTTPGKVIHVLLTRAPLYRGLLRFSCDLHVLGAPLTFALSQDQTLVFKDRGGWILGETRVSRPRIAWLFAAVRAVTLAFRLRVPLFAGFLVAGDAVSRGLFLPRQVTFFVLQFLFSAELPTGLETVSFETGSFASLLRRAGRGVYTRLRSSVNLFRLFVRRCRSQRRPRLRSGGGLL
jgi:hypothetical protein